VSLYVCNCVLCICINIYIYIYTRKYNLILKQLSLLSMAIKWSFDVFFGCFFKDAFTDVPIFDGKHPPQLWWFQEPNRGLVCSLSSLWPSVFWPCSTCRFAIFAKRTGSTLVTGTHSEWCIYPGHILIYIYIYIIHNMYIHIQLPIFPISLDYLRCNSFWMHILNWGYPSIGHPSLVDDHPTSSVSYRVKNNRLEVWDEAP